MAGRRAAAAIIASLSYIHTDSDAQPTEKSFIFIFKLGRIAGGSNRSRTGSTSRFRIFKIILLVLHQTGPSKDGDVRDSSPRTRNTINSSLRQFCWVYIKKQGRRCSQATWSLADLWALSPWVWPAGRAPPIFSGTSWSRGQTIVAEISLFGEVVQNSGLYEFRSCVLCHGEWTLRKIPSLPLALAMVYFFQ